MKRYRMTRCRDKRSIVRALNTFAEQYDFIYCSKKEINLAIEPMVLNYGDDKKDFLFGITGDQSTEKNKMNILDEILGLNNIIYSRAEAMLDLRNTKLILETIDNLISINKQKHIKRTLKSVVRSREDNGINYFFHNESIAINSISLKLNTGDEEKYTDAFIRKIISQMKNRILFHRSGIYTNNDTPSRVINQKIIKSVPTSLFDILSKQLYFLISNLSTLSLETKDDVEQARMVYARDSQHPDFDISCTELEENSGLFHPINEGDDEPDLTECARQSNMPLPLLLRERDGLYNEEEWTAYNEYEDHESIYNELADIVDELTPYISEEKTLFTNIYEEFTSDEIAEFEYYNKNKPKLSKENIQLYRIDLINLIYRNNKKKKLYEKISLLQNYFLSEDVTPLLKRYQKKLDIYGFVFTEEEFLDAYKIQNELFSWYKCHSLEEYKCKFNKVGINQDLLKNYSEYDMERSYWFDAEMYPCYSHLLPEDFYEEDYNETEEELSIDMVSEEEILQKYGYTELSLSEEEQELERQKAIEFAKTHPPIPF